MLIEWKSASFSFCAIAINDAVTIKARWNRLINSVLCSNWYIIWYGNFQIQSAKACFLVHGGIKKTMPDTCFSCVKAYLVRILNEKQIFNVCGCINLHTYLVVPEKTKDPRKGSKNKNHPKRALTDTKINPKGNGKGSVCWFHPVSYKNISNPSWSPFRCTNWN